MTTTEVALTPSYQAVAVGASGNLIIQGASAFMLHIDKATQPADSDPGILFSPSEGKGFAAAGLAGKSVWIKQGTGYGSNLKAVVSTW